jgi:hypothetical protein
MNLGLTQLKLSSNPCRTLLAYIPHLDLWLLILLSVGCLVRPTVEGTAAPSQPGSPTPMLMIQRPPGTIVAAEDIAEIQDVLPFGLALPEDLPLGLPLSRVSAHLPHNLFDDQSKDLNTSVVLGFGNENATAGFELHESLSPPRIGSSAVRSIRLDNTIVKVDSNEEQIRIAAVWEGCDTGFFLI